MTMTPKQSKRGNRVMRVINTMSHDIDDFEYDFDDIDVKPVVIKPSAESIKAQKPKAPTGGSTKAKVDPKSKAESKAAPKEKRKRGRPPGSLTKTEEVRVAEGRRYRERVLSIYKNPRLNELTSEMFYDHPETGKETKIADKEPALVGTRCTIDYGKYVPTTDGRLILLNEAVKNSYNPVHQFLDSAKQTRVSTAAQDIWDNFGGTVTGTDSAHYTKVLQALMVAAVARTKTPGASVPFMPILEGAQGVGKSSFLKALVDLEFRAEINSMPDQLLQDPGRLHVGWMLEFPEVDRLFKPNTIEALKTLITTDVDSTRRPYAELPVKLMRAFVLVGTTNSREFLLDVENRRFPILSIKRDHKVPIDLIKKHRLELWHLAVDAYENGFDWIPSSKDLQDMVRYQVAYQSRDPWAALIYRYILDKETVSCQSILEAVLEVSKKDMTPAHSRRVGKILLQFGWERLGPRQVNGKMVRLFGPGPTWDPTNIDI